MASITGIVAGARNLAVLVLVLIACITVPIVFLRSNMVGPDIGAMAFSAFGVYFLWKDVLSGTVNAKSSVRYGSIGLLLGMAFLWRSHAIIFAWAVLVLTVLLFGVRPIRPILWMVCSFFVVISIQVFANLVSGHGTLETAQNFNVYKFLYGVDWLHPPSKELIENFSVLKAIADDPRLFFNAYLPAFWDLVVYAWPGVFCFLVAPEGQIKRFGLFSAMITLLYAIPVSIGNSPSAPLILMVPFLASLAFLYVVLMQRATSATGFVKGLLKSLLIIYWGLGIYLIGSWAFQDIELLKSNYREHRAFLAVERVLVEKGIITSTQVFSDYYYIYFPNLPPYQPRFVGGWEQDWLWGYSLEYPKLPSDSWEHFVKAGREQGIQFLVLSPSNVECGKIFPSSDIENESDLHFIASRSGFNICKFENKKQ